jgi:hypothetical protein
VLRGLSTCDYKGSECGIIDEIATVLIHLKAKG